jgi:hypothetical protein
LNLTLPFPKGICAGWQGVLEVTIRGQVHFRLEIEPDSSFPKGFCAGSQGVLEATFA